MWSVKHLDNPLTEALTAASLLPAQICVQGLLFFHKASAFMEYFWSLSFSIR